MAVLLIQPRRSAGGGTVRTHRPVSSIRFFVPSLSWQMIAFLVSQSHHVKARKHKGVIFFSCLSVRYAAMIVDCDRNREHTPVTCGVIDRVADPAGIGAKKRCPFISLSLLFVPSLSWQIMFCPGMTQSLIRVAAAVLSRQAVSRSSPRSSCGCSRACACGRTAEAETFGGSCT